MTVRDTNGRDAQVEAVIFDLDGVLADTEPVHLEASRTAIAPAEIAFEEYVRFVGGGEESYTDWIERTYGMPRAEFNARYSVFLLERLRHGPPPVMDGADALVRAVHRRGLRVAVASMSRRDWVEATLEAIGLTNLIPLVVTRQDVAEPKPSPDIYLLTAQLLGVEPHACIAVEDSVHGVASAAAAGMRVVQSRQATIAAAPQPGAHAVISSLTAFDVGWLDGTPLA